MTESECLLCRGNPGLALPLYMLPSAWSRRTTDLDPDEGAEEAMKDVVAIGVVAANNALNGQTGLEFSTM